MLFGINDDKGFAYIDSKRRFRNDRPDDTNANPIRLLRRGMSTDFVPSANGRKLFVVGIATNEFAPCIWRYDMDADSLDCVVPALERSSYATKSEND